MEQKSNFTFMDSFPQPPRFKKLVTPPVLQPTTAEDKNRPNPGGKGTDSGNTSHPSQSPKNKPTNPQTKQTPRK